MSTISAGTTSTTTLIHSGDTTGSLVLKTNDTGSGGTTAVTIDTSQNVGIGTSSPSYKLDVQNGTARIYNSTYPSLRIHNSTTGTASNDGLLLEMAGADANFVNYEVGNMIFKTTDTERMRIDSSGNVGIGTTSPSAKFVVAGGGAAIQGNGYPSAGSGWELYTDNSTGTGSNGSWLQSYSRTSSAWMQANYNALAHIFSTSGAERMRIDSSGIVLVGATSARTTQAKIELTSAANTALSFYMYKTSQVEMAMGFKSSTDTNFYIGTGSTSVGTNGVYLTNTGSSWNAVSDERMKTILEPITNAAEKVSSLRAVIGYYNNDESQIRRPFLIAQDVQKVLPEAVNVQDQETGTLGMSYTDTIPLLVAAIKEQQALIQQLQADVAALKGV